MGDSDAVNTLPVVGTPLAYGLALVALLLVVFARSWAGAVTTVAHEGGHMVLAVLTFRGLKGFELEDNGNAVTRFERGNWSISWIVTGFAGYATPPLLGLGGAALIAHRQLAGVLWISLILLIAAFIQARNTLAYVVTMMEIIGVGWVVAAGTVQIQAAVAVGLVWLLLIGGALESSVMLSRGQGSDAYALASRTLIPRIVWHALWALIGIVCLWQGGGQLLGLR